MNDFDKILVHSRALEYAIESRNETEMVASFSTLDKAYQEEYGDSFDSFECIKSYFIMKKAAMRFFAFNNFYRQVKDSFQDLTERFEGFKSDRRYSKDEKAEIASILRQAETISKSATPKHRNLVIPREDFYCCLCRKRVANKTGSHMVPNFLAHPTFSWDGEGKRDHEALNHSCLNGGNRHFDTYYGPAVPGWRFAMGNGKPELKDEDIDENVNYLEFDNEFCSDCEDRFGILETNYSQFYNEKKKQINPRLSFLFWMSVVWRMAISRMGLFMDIDDEFFLRELLDKNILETDKAIEKDTSDLGEWKYAIFRASGLREGDKGILGSRIEHAPYVVMYNDLIMVFFNHAPKDDELTIGPITIDREMLCDWHEQEKGLSIDRRQFWNVRDWITETSYAYADPGREKALLLLREQRRTHGKDYLQGQDNLCIEVGRLSNPCNGKPMKLHKMERIYAAYMREHTSLVDGNPVCSISSDFFNGGNEEFQTHLKDIKQKALVSEALLNGEEYDPLQDEDLFLTQEDFDKYYQDLANISREFGQDFVSTFPYYDKARAAISDENAWKMKDIRQDLPNDDIFKSFIQILDGSDIEGNSDTVKNKGKQKRKLPKPSKKKKHKKRKK